MKRRITLVVDEIMPTVAGCQVVWQDAQRFATVESVEDIPEPVRQRFILDVVTDPDLPALDADSFLVALQRRWTVRQFTVNEVEPS